jgi:hypothetical protein
MQSMGELSAQHADLLALDPCEVDLGAEAPGWSAQVPEGVIGLGKTGAVPSVGRGA